MKNLIWVLIVGLACLPLGMAVVGRFKMTVLSIVGHTCIALLVALVFIMALTKGVGGDITVWMFSLILAFGLVFASPLSVFLKEKAKQKERK